MTQRHDEIAASILNRDPEDYHEVTAADVEEIYSIVAKNVEGNAPIVTGVRIDRRVVLQFSEWSKIQLEVHYDKKVKPKRADFARFIPHLEYQDTTPEREGFFGRAGRELKDNWLPLLLGIGALWVFMWQFGSQDGWTNLFTASAQVVSIFTAVFMVFAAVQRPASRSLITVFTTGRLDEFYLTDLFLAKLAIISIFTTLTGSFIAKFSDSASQPITGSLGSFVFSITPYAILLWLVGTLLMVELVILFVSLPQYYFARGRRMLYRELLAEVLTKRYEELAAPGELNITALHELVEPDD